MLCLQWPTPRLWEPHHRWNYLSCETFCKLPSSVLQLVCLIILEREKCILFIRSEIIDFMVNFRQVPPTSQTRTYLASPMDWMPLGNSCLIPHPQKKTSLSYWSVIVPPLLLYHPPQTYIQHVQSSMDGEECEDGDITEPIASCTSLTPASPRENGRHEVSVKNWHHHQMSDDSCSWKDT